MFSVIIHETDIEAVIPFLDDNNIQTECYDIDLPVNGYKMYFKSRKDYDLFVSDNETGGLMYG